MLKIIILALHVNLQKSFPIEKESKLLHLNILRGTKFVILWLIKKTNFLTRLTMIKIFIHFVGTNTTILWLGRWINIELKKE